MFQILEITVDELKTHKKEYTLVDVRESHELTGPEGQIEGVILATLGTPLTHFLDSTDPDEKYIFICRSGKRSAYACELAHAYGILKTYNLKGGMLAWNGKANLEKKNL
ncbi:MAG: rhodanese-like domain-containing protein [Alphaproteobacteria bacterium]|nr:rhodanese-like domain-containing protein [Alphaproteobacteria bacterium]